MHIFSIVNKISHIRTRATLNIYLHRKIQIKDHSHLVRPIPSQFFVSFLRLGGIDCMILSALTLSSTLRVKRYLDVLSLNFVIPFLLFFLIVIFSGVGRSFLSLLTILMNSFKSLISLGYENV